MSSLPSERIAVVATVDPIDGNNTTIKTDAVDVSKFHEAMFVLMTGVMNDSATVTGIAVQESATTSDGDFAAMSPAKTASNLAGTDDGEQVVLEVKAEELTAGKRYVRLVATVSAHSVLIAAIGLGLLPRFGPASDDDLASVTISDN
jgi:hypothetical protein